ncbi:Protein kinase domain containing protein [Pyrenophora tritici-repentis]|nr:Protein kinase domain containing protein [Pyrenophora tritici-repentis]
MAPPYRRAYDYFLWDASQYINQNRPTWNKTHKANTISTIWKGDPLTRNHYSRAPNHPTGPGMRDPNLIRAVPYTANDATRARTSGILPLAPPAAAPAVPPAPPQVPAPVPAGAPVPVPVQTTDTYPYSFWPNTPWDRLPDHYAPVENPANFCRDPKATKTAKSKVYKAWLNSHIYRDLELTDEEQVWRGAKYLGHGAFGSAGLWVRCDITNTISDRIVVKEVEPHPLAWKCPDEWRDKLPREIHMHQLIDSHHSEATHRNLVRHRGYRLMMQACRYRIFLELCDGGQLATGLEYHWYRRNTPSTDFNTLPEGFIWRMFHGLVKACIVLQEGNPLTAVPGWKPLIHNDLHMGNVLLKSNGPTKPPDVVLMDYGRTFYDLNPETTVTPDTLHSTDNPSVYRIAYENGRYPPETQPSKTIIETSFSHTEDETSFSHTKDETGFSHTEDETSFSHTENEHTVPARES